MSTWPISFLILAAALAASPAPRSAQHLFEESTPAVAQNRIDELVFERLRALGLSVPPRCSDAVFVRRAYLDIIGTLPTAAEALEFLRRTDPNRRDDLIDRLLDREEFAVYWAMKWGDVLRIKAEFPANLWPNAAQAYHRWVQASIAANKPYNQFARELLTSSDSNFRVGPVNFYRAVQNRTPQGIVSAVALTFMGARVDAWPSNRLAGAELFFSQIGYKPTSEWKEEHVFWDPLGSSAVAGNSAPGKDSVSSIGLPAHAAAQPAIQPRASGQAVTAMLPDGTTVRLAPDRDPREVFADWLITPWNPWFTRAIANRVWAWLLGRGIIHEPDDIRPDNRPSHPELLAYLEKELVAKDYNLKHLYRLILRSATYQLSSMPRPMEPEAAAQFASYRLRRLEAEVLIDAINRVTGASDLYTSPIPEPYTYIPADKPAIAIGDGSITSPFLALFGRSARATGMENERNNNPVPAQWLHLLNSSHIQRKLEQGPKLHALFDPKRKPQDIAQDLYLTILSRFPTPDELKTVEDYAKPARPKAATRRADWVDVAWALINSPEFIYRH